MIGKLASVRAEPDTQRLRLAWDDGERVTLDLAPIIASHANLAPLNDPQEFAQVRLSEDGWSIEWPSGVEFGAPQLRVWALQPAGVLISG